MIRVHDTLSIFNAPQAPTRVPCVPVAGIRDVASTRLFASDLHEQRFAVLVDDATYCYLTERVSIGLQIHEVPLSTFQMIYLVTFQLISLQYALPTSY